MLSGEPPERLPKDANWCKPKLERTKWFDLFDVDQRVEAFRALGGVMEYLTRKGSVGTETSEPDAQMGGTQ